MSVIGFPTSSDIFIEANGRKLAVVQSYKVATTRSEQIIEAFGESEPIATIASAVVYRIELTRLYATDEAIRDGINFYQLQNFSLVIVKPDKRVIYTGCQWSSIEERGELSRMVAERISVISSNRVEMPN